MTVENPAILLFVAAVILVSAVVQGMSGFGFALVNVPFLLFVLNPREVVPLNTLLGTVLNAAIFWEARHHLERRHFQGAALIVGGYFLGAFGGTWLLLILPEKALKVLVYASMVSFALLIWRGRQIHVRHERAMAGIVGLASGLIGSTTSMGGPPIVLYLAARRYDKEVFRALLGLYGFLLSGMQVAIFAVAGVFTVEVWRMALLLAAALVAGYWIGRHLFIRIPQDAFRRIVLLIVIVTAIAGLAALPFER